MEASQVIQASTEASLEQRRRAVHVQRIRSIAETDPQALADVITRWLAEDDWRLLLRRAR